MKELKKDLLTTKYTKVMVEEEYSYNAPHRFMVVKAAADTTCGNVNCVYAYCPYSNMGACKDYKKPEQGSDVLCDIHFQEGPIKECGVNGVCGEDLICMVIDRLEHFQESEFRCRENAMAITKLEEALLWLRKRTMGREQRGVEGTHIV